MRQAIKGVLISGLVFPGVGQFVLKRVGIGLVFMIIAIACLTVIISAVAQQAMNALANLASVAAIDPNALANVAQQAANGTAGPFYNLAVIVLSICWVWSMVDAWLAGKAMDDGHRQGS